jgi:hypothetical protein
LNNHSVEYECSIVVCTQRYCHTDNNNQHTTSDCIRMLQWRCLTIETRHDCYCSMPPTTGYLSR